MPGGAAECAARASAYGRSSIRGFGKVECWGEEGHCAEPMRRKFDRRRNPTRFAKIRVRTEQGALAQALERAGEDATLHVVVVVPESPGIGRVDPAEVLRFQRLSIITYA